MLTIKNRKGMAVGITSAAVTPDERIAFLSIVGAQTAVKALWASVLNRRAALHISGRSNSYYGDDNVEYVTLKQSPAPGVHHWVMFPEPGPSAPYLLLVPLGMSREEQLVKLLNQHTLWPVKDEWGSVLWEQGITAGDDDVCLIRELEVHGNLDWAYAVSTIGWDDVIDQAARQGSLFFGGRP
ncbi:MAG: hypothetical protein GY851_24630 [bacterium]|nr:hypothetical protein [bacterium]